MKNKFWISSPNSTALSFIERIATVAFFLCAVLALSGCGDFFSERATELESRNILREISTPKETPANLIQVPDIYKLPPRIVEGKVGENKDAKLFYFTKYHSPSNLAKLIDEQFLKQFFDKKGKPYPVKDYGVSVNSGANQIIVRCPSVEDAEEVKIFLEQVDVPPIQVKIDCLISEVYADHTMDWETTIDIQNLLGSELNLSGKQVNGNILPAFPGAALRDAARSTFGLKAGFVHGDSDNKVNALIDLLVSRGYLKILMNPTLEVVNGKTATIHTQEQVPMDEISRVHPTTGIISLTTRYEDVIDSLEITPTVYGDGYIGIKTKAVIGSKSTPEGVKQVPILTKREVEVEENRIRAGESLIIGGITKTEKRSVVRGVPFLKDIPILGVLFSSKDFEERGKEVLFILTPSISTGGNSNKEMLKEINAKHKMLEIDSDLMKTLTDPLGRNIYTDIIEKEATEAETERIRAEIKKTHAERKAKMLQEELEKATNTSENDQKLSKKAKEIVDKMEENRTNSKPEQTIVEWLRKRTEEKNKLNSE